MRSGYYHIGLSENSKGKTAFVTPFGKYQFEAVPFGLAQAPAYFQQLISVLLQSCSDFAMAYLDDIIIFSKNEKEHLKHIEIIFQKLKEAGLKLKESRCYFFKKDIHYLGHLISDKGIYPLPEKLDTIQNMPKPRNPKEIKQFLGLCGYYRKLVPHCVDIWRPLAKLTGQDIKWDWCVRYHVPEFPHSSATFNIILRSRIQAFSQSSYKDHWVTVHVLCSAANCIQCQPIGTSQA